MKTSSLTVALAVLVLPIVASAVPSTHSRLRSATTVTSGKGRSSMRGYGNIGVQWSLRRGTRGDRLVIRRALLHPGEAHERFNGTVARTDRYGSALLQHPDHAPINVTRSAVKTPKQRYLRYVVQKPAGRFSPSEVKSALREFAGNLTVTSEKQRVGAFSGQGRFLSGGYERGASWRLSGKQLQITVEPKYRGESINSSGTYAIALPGASKTLVNVTARKASGQFVFKVDLRGKQPTTEQLVGLVEKFAGRPSSVH